MVIHGMRLVEELVAVDKALDAYRDALTRAYVTVSDAARHRLGTERGPTDEELRALDDLYGRVEAIRDRAFDGTLDHEQHALVRDAAKLIFVPEADE